MVSNFCENVCKFSIYFEEQMNNKMDKKSLALHLQAYMLKITEINMIFVIDNANIYDFFFIFQ